MGALHDALKAAETDEESALIKAQAWVDENLPTGWTRPYRQHKVTLSGQPSLADRFVRFTMTVETNQGVDITPPDFNPCTIVNPPYLVEDPNGDVPITYTDADGNPQTKWAREDVLTRLVHQLEELADRIIDGA